MTLLPPHASLLRGVGFRLRLCLTPQPPANAYLACLFAWKVWLLVVDSWQTGMRSSTYLLTPLWIPQGTLGVGFSFLAVAAVFTPLCELFEGMALRRHAARQASAPVYEQKDGLSLHPE